MTWIIFDEADHYSPAPDFCLPAQDGTCVCLRDFRGDCNLVLLISRDRNWEELWAVIESFGTRLEDYRDLDARVLAVLSQAGGLIQARLSASKVKIPLLSDPEEKVWQAYSGLMDASLVTGEDLLIFVLDRYNAPYAAWIGKELSDPTVHQEVQSWLAYIGVQCPE